MKKEVINWTIVIVLIAVFLYGFFSGLNGLASLTPRVTAENFFTGVRVSSSEARSMHLSLTCTIVPILIFLVWVLVTTIKDAIKEQKQKDLTNKAI